MQYAMIINKHIKIRILNHHSQQQILHGIASQTQDLTGPSPPLLQILRIQHGFDINTLIIIIYRC
jgi:hypothetical protein